MSDAHDIKIARMWDATVARDAEIARLREALRQIAVPGCQFWPSESTYCVCAACVARRALEDTNA